MGTVVVDVMLKSEIRDPQGQAVVGALPGLGFNQFTSVRQGKRFELEVEGDVTEEVLASAREAAAAALADPDTEKVVAVRSADAVAEFISAAQDQLGWSDGDIEALLGTEAGFTETVERTAPTRREHADVDQQQATGLADGVYGGEDDDDA